jgi:hypothetical protein
MTEGMSKPTFLPAVTPFQFIALLDELCAAGCGKTGEKKDVTFYQITIDNIRDGAAILKGKGKKAAAPLTAPPPALTPPQFIAIMDEICNVDDGVRRRHQNNEVYMVTTGDIIEGLGRVFRGR